MPDGSPADPFTGLAEAAVAHHELFTAYVHAGFDRAEALQLLIAIIIAALQSGQPGG